MVTMLTRGWIIMISERLVKRALAEIGERERTARLRPAKRPGCVKAVEDSVREHRGEISDYVDALGFASNASAADVAEMIVALVEDGMDFAELPKPIHDDVVHAYMAAKLG